MIRDFDEMSQLFSQMDRLFETMQDRTTLGMHDGGRRDGTHDGRVRSGMRGTPMLDGQLGDDQVREHRMLDARRAGREGTTKLTAEDGKYVFVMDLPGYETDEIDLVFRDGRLRITASTELTDETGTRSIRRSRSTNETVTIPGDVDVETIDASYHNGVLEVSLPMLDDDVDDGHVIDVR